MPFDAERPIGVFDSGVGGLSILQALRTELPQENFVYVADSGFAPYGEREADFVVERARTIAQHLCRPQSARPAIKALVIACNTATAAAIHLLRQDHPDLPIIGVEPALKPAVAISQTKRIGVLATRGTLQSAKFQALLASLSTEARFICQPCDGLADAIEHDDTSKTIALCAQYTCATGHFGLKDGEIDTLVLGCTHYPFASQHFAQLLGPQIKLVSNGEPVARHTRRMLKDFSSQPQPGQITLLSTGKAATLQQAANRWLQLACPVQSLS